MGAGDLEEGLVLDGADEGEAVAVLEEGADHGADAVLALHLVAEAPDLTQRALKVLFGLCHGAVASDHAQVGTRLSNLLPRWLRHARR